jgi:hypothetical protein
VPQVASASSTTGARERDPVEIALDEHLRGRRGGSPRAPRQAVERLALVEDRALGRVQVLRLLALGERATAEADDAAARVANREREATAQPVVVARTAVARGEQARPSRRRGRHTLRRERARHRVPAVGGEADLEALGVFEA